MADIIKQESQEEVHDLLSFKGKVANSKDEVLLQFGRELLNESKQGKVDKVLELLQLGTPFTADWLGTSPLHLASQYNQVKVVEVLLRKGISPDARNKVDRTPLHIACHLGHLEIVKLLLAFNADPGIKDMLKMTPLHWAAEGGLLSVVQLVIQHGCPIDCLDKFGKTALDIAQDKGNYEIVRVIQEMKDLPVTEKADLICKTKCQSFSVGQRIISSEDKSGMKEPMIERKKTSLTYAQRIERVEKRQLLDKGSEEGLCKVAKISEQDWSPESNESIERHTTDKKKKTRLTYARRIELVRKRQLEETGSGGDRSDKVKERSDKCSPPQSNESKCEVETAEFLLDHGITLTEPEARTVVSSAVQSGHSVVLTEAGKLALLTSEPDKSNLRVQNQTRVTAVQDSKKTSNPLASKSFKVNQVAKNGNKIVTFQANLLSLPPNKTPPEKVMVKGTVNIPRAKLLDGKLYSNLDLYIQKVKEKRKECGEVVKKLKQILKTKENELAKYDRLLNTALNEMSEKE